MHWGKICALASVIALTLLSFASCGPLKFKGLDLITNQLDASAIADDMGKAFGAEPSSGESKKETIFEGSDSWLHYLYLAMVAVALIGILVKPKVFALIGGLGLILTVVFMFSFDNWFKKKGKEDGGPGSDADNPFQATMSLDWDEGAWIALAGFAGLAIAGFQARKSGGGGGGGGDE